MFLLPTRLHHTNISIDRLFGTVRQDVDRGVGARSTLHVQPRKHAACMLRYVATADYCVLADALGANRSLSTLLAGRCQLVV